ncbi:polyubiquitin-like isoform X1 [Durio zibethinus]|uniref:Polyubiquitin-like isoform X1 n=2 Tax=Durio zibethinus TaxID=66656 RepID=A0A6P5X0I4_DURZI|nr:polyubiquitin-like isoform X1 [Durio zibethinus]XP_022721915.1 polyubiquitin-like isoform X1 [Durio zibethinus]
MREKLVPISLMNIILEKIAEYLHLMDIEKEDRKVKPTETIKNFNEKGIISENIQDCSFSSQPLKDDERLVYLGNLTDHVVVNNFFRFKLLVKIPSEKRTIVVEARALDTVQRIKSSIQLREGIEMDQFSLVYEGKLIEEDRILSSLNVKNESTICLVFCPKDVLSIYVKALTGEVVKLKVKVTFTVADVKAIAGGKLGSSVGSLFYLGQQLEDSKILACYDIKEESMLEMLHPQFQIFVRTWSGRTLTLDVKQSSTVQDVKDKIFQKLKIPVHLQSIVFAGKRLEKGRDLASYSIQKHSTLCMVFAPSSTIMHMKVSKISRHISHLTTVRDVKELLRSKKGIPVKEVLFEKAALHDDISLDQYGIHKKATLAIVY